MEIIDLITSLGIFPIWFLMIAISFWFLHKTGVLDSLGAIFGQTLNSMQSTHSKLLMETLKQNGLLIDVITDRLISDVDIIKDRQIRTDTKFSFVIHALEKSSPSNDGKEYENFRLISELQEKISQLESKVNRDTSP